MKLTLRELLNLINDVEQIDCQLSYIEDKYIKAVMNKEPYEKIEEEIEKLKAEKEVILNTVVIEQ